MKKTLALLMILMLSISFVFAGGESEASDESSSTPEVSVDDLYGIELVMYHAQNQENADALDMVLDLFNNTNEYGIHVTGQYQGSYGPCHQKVLGALASDTAPNIAQAYNNNMMYYIPSGLLMDLTPYFQDEYGITPEEYATIDPAYLGENSAFPDGNMYAVSLGKSAEALFYNKDFFDEHGLEVPTTLDELTEVAKQASEILGKPAFGLDSKDNWGIYGPMNFGAKYADLDGNIYLFDEDNIDKTKAFYEWWANGCDNGWFRTGLDDGHCSGPFGAGDIVMFIGSCSGVNYIKSSNFEIGVSAVPVGPDPHVIQQGGNFCGFKSGDPATDLATSIFLEFLYTAEPGALYAANTGYLPSNLAAHDEEEFINCIEEGGLNGRTKAVCSSYPDEWRAYDPVFEESFAVRKLLATPLEAIEITDLSIDDIIADTIVKLDEILDK